MSVIITKHRKMLQSLPLLVVCLLCIAFSMHPMLGRGGPYPFWSFTYVAPGLQVTPGSLIVAITKTYEILLPWWIIGMMAFFAEAILLTAAARE